MRDNLDRDDQRVKDELERVISALSLSPALRQIDTEISMLKYAISILEEKKQKMGKK